MNFNPTNTLKFEKFNFQSLKILSDIGVLEEKLKLVKTCFNFAVSIILAKKIIQLLKVWKLSNLKSIGHYSKDIILKSPAWVDGCSCIVTCK